MGTLIPLSARFQLRRDTTINWASNRSVVLNEGEPGYDKDLRIMKIGNGRDPWSKLPSIGKVSDGGYSVAIWLADIPYTDDRDIHLNSIYSDTARNGCRIQLFDSANPSVIIQTNTVSLPFSETGSYTFSLTGSNYLEYGKTYGISVSDASGKEIGRLTGINFTPSITFTQEGSPYVVSRKTIGVNIGYRGPRIPEIQTYASSYSSTANIQRQYNTSSETRIIYITNPSGFVDNTEYNIGIGNFLNTTILFKVPTLDVELVTTNYTQARLTFNQSIPIDSVEYRVNNSPPTITLYNRSLYTSFTETYTNQRPAFNSNIRVKVILADNETLEQTLIFNRGAIINSLTINTNGNGFASVIQFSGTQSYTFRIKSDNTVVKTYTLRYNDSSSSPTSSVLYPYNYSLNDTYVFDFGKTYVFEIVDTDSTILSETSINTDTRISNFTNIVPVFVDSNTIKVDGLVWVGAVSYTGMTANLVRVSDQTTIASNTGVNSGDSSISIDEDATFVTGETYKITLILPDNSEITSNNTNPYVPGGITFNITDNNSFTSSITWPSGSVNATVQIQEANVSTGPYSDFQSSFQRTNTSSQYSRDLVTGTYFTHNKYYRLRMTFDNGDILESSPFHYTFSMSFVGVIQLSASSYSVNVLASSLGSIFTSERSSNRIYIQLFAHSRDDTTPLTISTAGLTDLPVSSTPYTGNNTISTSISFVRGNYYYAKLRLLEDGPVLATTSVAVKYDPVDIQITLQNDTLGSNSNSIGYTIARFGPTGTNYDVYLQNETTTTELSRVINLSSTGNNTFPYTFPIEPSSLESRTPYKLYASIPLSTPIRSSTELFYYTYNSSTSDIVSAVPLATGTGVSIGVNWQGFSTMLSPVIYLGTSGNTEFSRPVSYIVSRAINSTTLPSRDIVSPVAFSPNTSYNVRILLNSDRFLTSSRSFTYNPVRCNVTLQSLTSTSIVLNFAWSGMAYTTPMNITLNNVTKSNANLLSSPQTVTRVNGVRTYNFSTPISSGDVCRYTITLPDSRETCTGTFTFRPPVVTNQGLSFQDQEDAIGVLFVNPTITSSIDELRLDYRVLEYTSSSSISSTTIVSRTDIPITSGVPLGRRETNENFTFGRFYNVFIDVYQGSTYFITNQALLNSRIEYNPKGYDILIFAGQSNMIGRDDVENKYSYPTPLFSRTVPYETSIPPIYTTDEINNAIIDQNGNPVKFMNSSNNLVDLKADRTVFFSVNETDNTRRGVSQAYQFVKYYAASPNILRSNRRIGVVFAPRGGTGFSDGWAPPNGGLYTTMRNSINNFETLTYSGSVNYTCNRANVFVWHQGEADVGLNTWYESLHSMFTSILNDTSPIMHPSYTTFTIGNIDMLTAAKTIEFATGNDIAKLRNAYSVPNQIDAITDISRPYKITNYSSLGLLGIDPDPILRDTTEGGTHGTDIHFSARSERILGLRAFASFFRSRYPGVSNQFVRVVPQTESPIEILRYNFQQQTLVFDSTAMSERYNVNPVAYIITAVVSPQSGSGITAYGIFTEYNTAYTTINNPTNARTCFIPGYVFPNALDSGLLEAFTDPNARIRFEGVGSDVNFTMYSLNVPSISGVNVPLFSNNEIITTGSPSSSLTPKTLIGSLRDFLHTLIESSSALDSDQTQRTVKLANANVTISIQNILSNASINTTLDTNSRTFRLGTKYYLPPVLSNRILAIGGLFTQSLTILQFSPNWLVSPNTSVGGNGTPVLVGNAPFQSGGGVAIFAGASTPNTNTNAMSSADRTAFQNAGGQTFTVGSETFSVVGVPTLRSGAGSLSNIENSEMFPRYYKDTWSFQSRSGLLFTRVTRGLDWVFFFSEGHYETISFTPSGLPASQRINSVARGTQFTGVAFEGSSPGTAPVGERLGSILSKFKFSDTSQDEYTLNPVATNQSYYYIYGTGCGFVLQLRNMIGGKRYRVRYYISTRAGRVPRNATVLESGYDYYMSNPLPIRLYTSTPERGTSGVVRTEYLTRDGNPVGQDVVFGTGTNSNNPPATRGLTTTYIHNGLSPWDGSWKEMTFRFDMPVSGGADSELYSYNHAFLKFGPIPSLRAGFDEANYSVMPVNAGGSINRNQLEHIGTSINIGGISVTIDNNP